MAGRATAGTQQVVLWGGADQPTMAAHSSALQKAVSTAGEKGMGGSWGRERRDLRRGLGREEGREGGKEEDWVSS